MARSRSVKAKAAHSTRRSEPKLYTLDVFILSGRLTKKFGRKSRTLLRTIQIRGDQTLEDLHQAIFAAFDRWDEHLFEFQFGKGPMDPNGTRYVMQTPFGFDDDDAGASVAGLVEETTIDDLGLKVGDSFGYWFDFGDDWWHQIDVEAIEDKLPKGKLPKVTKRIGKSPPQYADDEE